MLLKAWAQMKSPLEEHRFIGQGTALAPAGKRGSVFVIAVSSQEKVFIEGKGWTNCAVKNSTLWQDLAE